MDSLSQVVLGSSVAMLCGGRVLGRKTLLIGAMLGTLPDLDVLISYGNAVDDVTKHRGFSHAFAVLIPLSVVFFAIAYRFSATVRQQPWPIFWMICLSLITHPILDAFTNYGTQLFWPLAVPPTALSSVFIIDPFYTLPLLIACIYLALKDRPWQRQLRVSQLALFISSVYLAWTLSAQAYIEREFNKLAREEVSATLITPLPFNSLYWRVLWVEQDQYYEAFMPLWRLDFNAEAQPLQRQIVSDFNSSELSRLRWFSQDKLKYSRQGDYLVVSDLRLGSHGFFPFSFIVAKDQQGQWQAVSSQILPTMRPSWQELKAFWRSI